MDTKVTFNSLRSRRKQMGYTLKQVAFLLELPDTSMPSRWERGLNRPMLEDALKLAVIYGTSCDSLFIDYRNDLREVINARHREMLARQVT